RNGLSGEHTLTAEGPTPAEIRKDSCDRLRYEGRKGAADEQMASHCLSPPRRIRGGRRGNTVHAGVSHSKSRIGQELRAPGAAGVAGRRPSKSAAGESGLGTRPPGEPISALACADRCGHDECRGRVSREGKVLRRRAAAPCPQVLKGLELR